MDHMCDVLSAALLCEEAAHDLTLGDARKKIIAGRYLDKVAGDKNLGIGATADIGQVLFKELVSYSMITLDKLVLPAAPPAPNSKAPPVQNSKAPPVPNQKAPPVQNSKAPPAPGP